MSVLVADCPRARIGCDGPSKKDAHIYEHEGSRPKGAMWCPLLRSAKDHVH